MGTSKTPTCEKDWLGGWDWDLQFQTPFFNKYLDLINSFSYGDELRAIEESIKQVITEKGSISQEHQDYLYDGYGDLAYEEHENTQLIYRSFVVSAFIFVEQNLINYCNHLKRAHGQTFDYLDMRGDGIGRPLRYINKVLGIDFPKNKQTRELLKAARAVRNIIVHNDAVPSTDELKHIKKIAPLFPKLLPEHFPQTISIDDAYAKSLIKLNKDLAEELRGACLALEQRTSQTK